MNHNDEKDPYTNHTFLTNYGYKFSDELDFRAIYKFTDSKLKYDAVKSNFDQVNNESHEKILRQRLNLLINLQKIFKVSLFLAQRI